uniref:Putative secreted protein n=1 Tax=Anopheles triannulatus TaxID=58253 RepID=A0A2M4B7P7_9DIPT
MQLPSRTRRGCGSTATEGVNLLLHFAFVLGSGSGRCCVERNCSRRLMQPWVIVRSLPVSLLVASEGESALRRKSETN